MNRNQHESTPLHRFHRAALAEDAAQLRQGIQAHLPGAELFFSTKTNPLGPLLRQLAGSGWCFEAASPGDLHSLRAEGVNGERILFSGAGWAPSSLADALFEQQVAQLTVDSPAMASLLATTLSSSRSRPPLRLAFRINEGESHFGFPLTGPDLAGAAKQLAHPLVHEMGLHLHRNRPGSATSPWEIGEDFAKRAKILAGLARTLPFVCHFLDLGGGIDSPWVYRPGPEEMGRFHHPEEGARLRSQHEKPSWSLQEAGKAIGRAVSDTLAGGPWRIQFEPGRAVCTRALSTVITVRAVKRGLYPDATIVITDGTTALLGPMHRGVHPFSTASANASSTGPVERCFVYGCLPHSGDWLFQGVPITAPAPGMRLEIWHTGAYFIPLEASFGHALPAVVDAESGALYRAPQSPSTN